MLLGNAAAAFPPVGQGGNAALESAIVLDQCLAAGPLHTVGARFEAAWRPEADAISWIGGQIRYQNPWMFVRTIIATTFGVNIAGQAKRSTRSTRRCGAARRLGPLWALSASGN